MESMIFGKNRHFFGGLEPSNMRKLEVVIVGSGIGIKAELPNDTVVDGQTLCSVAGAIVRRKIGAYPKDEFDGELAFDIKESGIFLDEAVEREDNVYYTAFPYSDQGVYNRSTSNSRAKNTYSGVGYIFGYDLDTTDPDPDTRVLYPNDVDNYNFTSAAMNYDTDTFDYGSWTHEPGECFMPKPCMLRYDGTVDHYLDPNDYTKKEDGSVSSIADLSFEGNAMMEWPKIYTKRWEEDGIYHFRCSDVKIDNTWDCWCNYDENNREIQHFYTPIYPGYFYAGETDRLRSISGLIPTDGADFGSQLSHASNNGSGWTLETFADRMLTLDLLVLMSKSTDCQTVYGRGYVNGSFDVPTNGSADKNGMFWGSTEGGNTVKVFGMENYWGIFSRRIVGWMSIGKIQKVKITSGTKDGSSVIGYNSTGNGYLSLESHGSPYRYNGYISKCITEGFGRIPFDSDGGSSSTYECDYMRRSESSSGTYCAAFGIRSDILAYNAMCCGPFNVTLDESNSGRTDFGASISYKPSAK